MFSGKMFQILGAAVLKALSPSVFFDRALQSSSNIPPSDLRLYLDVLLTLTINDTLG